MTKLTRKNAIRNYINECDTDEIMDVVNSVTAYSDYFDWLLWFDMEVYAGDDDNVE